MAFFHNYDMMILQIGKKNLLKYSQMTKSERGDHLKNCIINKCLSQQYYFLYQSYKNLTIENKVGHDNLQYKFYQRYGMTAAKAEHDLDLIFTQIDTNKDGFISRADLEATKYAMTIFEKDDSALNAFNRLDDKMNKQDFKLLANAYQFKWHEYAIDKFEVFQHLSKYFKVTSNGEASPHIKRSYIKLTTTNSQNESKKWHSVGFQFGIDRLQQKQMIQQLTKTLGHPPHQLFVLLKFKANKYKGEAVAKQLEQFLQEVVYVVQELVPEFEHFAKMVKVQAKYFNGYINLVIEIDNKFVDGIVNFINELIQTLSPQCDLKFTAKLSSNVQNILKQDFKYENCEGEILIELDVDNVTLIKLKEIMGDNINPTKQTPAQKLFFLFFEELRMESKFSNLGQALISTFNANIAEIPTPYNHINMIKELNLKQTVGQFFHKAPKLIDNLKDNCKFQGDLSINFHDVYAKVSFDLEIDQAFDLL